MKKFVIGNWKSNKSALEVIQFFTSLKEKFDFQKNDISSGIIKVICPVYIHLSQAKKLIEEFKQPFELGAQDISPFEMGPFTGEVNGSQLKELIKYVIIGHSERRSRLGETDELLRMKVLQANKWGIDVIYCVPDARTIVPEGVKIVAYEPVFAIGTGKSDTPENAGKVINEIKEKTGKIPVIYGGSVTPENIKDFLNREEIDGVLPGKSSLDPDSFYRMVINAAP